LKHRGRNRNRSVDLVQVIINMRNSDRIHIIELQRFH